MSGYPEFSKWVEVTLPPVEIQKVGHQEPFAIGTVVKTVYDIPSFYLFDELSHPDAWLPISERDPKHHVIWKTCDRALIVGHTFHVDPRDLRKYADTIRVRDFATAPRMEGAARMHMWYNIALKTGLFWARYDWLEKCPLDPPRDTRTSA